MSGLQFGEVWEDTAFPWTLQVHNTGRKPIRIASFSHSCSCATIEPRSLVIPAGETHELKLTIDLADTDVGSDEPTRQFRLQLWPQLELGGSVRYEWTVRGVVRKPVRLGQKWLDVGEVPEGNQPILPKRATVKALIPLRQLTVSCTSSAFQAVVRHRPGDLSVFDLEVAPCRTLPPGPIKFDIVVVPELPDGKRLSPKRLPVVGYILSDIKASPPEGVFGARSVGETVEETVTLHSLTGQTFAVSGVTAEGEGLSVRRLEVETGEPTFQIQQRITKPGEQTSSVVFMVRLADGVKKEINFGVCYRGLQESAVTRSLP